ncbi:MAG: glycoside hydrolase family 78 protein [Candidatus Methylacidiphilales bacterium]|nr:glycoside hydrolase family 78 protein [Candidatus Methylacidiphilales bacterium]
MTTVQSLRCEYRTDPWGLDMASPRLSWIAVSSKRAHVQKAYQIIVSLNPEHLQIDQGELWDSGWVESNRQNQIEYAGKSLESRMHCHWKVRIRDREGSVSPWSEPASWTMGLIHPQDWSAHWIGMEEALGVKPGRCDTLDPRADDGSGLLATPRCLRKTFHISQPIRRATLHATALGLYELRINGQRVGDHLLTPEWTNYHKRVQIQTWDATALLRKGTNTLGALLGNGWFSGLFQNWPCTVRMYGDHPLLLVQLEIESCDGLIQTVNSDDTWRGTLEGPLRFSGIYEGETYDARREMPGWDGPNFDDSQWRPVQVIPNPGAGRRTWSRGEPIRVSREIKPVEITEPLPGVYVFTFPQNMVGWTRLRTRGPSGQTIELQHGEMRQPDGTVFTENLRVVCQKHQSQLDRFILRGEGEETFEPHFTYHGFQHVEVRGLREKPTLDTLTGVVFHTTCPETGSFTCSEPLLNRLAQNILWSQRGNFMGIPTDCPQRDERCGYTGDAQFFVRAAVYNMDIAAFFSKWLVDLCQDSQLPGGWFADHAPHYCTPGAGPNIGWSDAGIICPYEIYRTYGDTRVIREHYPAMQRKMEWLKRHCPQHLFTGPVGNGDWLNKGGGVCKEVLGTAYAAYDFHLMAEMARAIGEEADARRYQEESHCIAEAFAASYLDAEGHIQESSQSGYALAFTMQLVPMSLRKAMAERFAGELERFDWHPATGFIGTPRLLPALHQAGLDQAAYRLLLTRTSPSWLHPITLGSTTIWEHWDSWDGQNPKGGMNSLNHYAFGSVGEYLFAHIGGIQAESPGYEQIRIQPVIREGLTWAHTAYDSIRGRIATAWKLEEGRLVLDVTIPANTSATVFIPTKDASQLTEHGIPIGNVEDVHFLKMEGSHAVLQVGSGSYHFATLIDSNLGDKNTG